MSGRPFTRGRGGGGDRGRGDGRGRGRGRGIFDGSSRGNFQQGDNPGRGGPSQRGGPGPQGGYESGRGPRRQQGQQYPGDGGATPGAGEKLISTFDQGRKPPKGTKIAHQQASTAAQVPDVKSIEDKYNQQISQDLTKLQLNDSRPYRPSYGNAGKPLQVYANFFVIETPKTLLLSHYSIGVPKALSTPKGRRKDAVLLALKKLPGFDQWKVVCGTDFAQRLVVIGRVVEIDNAPLEPEDATKPNSPSYPTLAVEIQDMKEDGTPSGKSWKIKFRHVSSHQVNDVVDYLSSPTGPFKPDTENLDVVQGFNILLGQYARLSDKIFIKSSSTRNKLWHMNTERQDIGRGLQALKGFISSVRCATGRLLLNVNNAAIAGHKPSNLMETMNVYKAGASVKETEYFVKTVRVHRTWLGSKSKTKSIWGFARKDDATEKGRTIMLNGKPQVLVPKDFAGPQEVKFLYEGNHVTVFDFFKQKYPNFPIRFPGLPVINIGNKLNPSYVPAELCTIVDGQDYRGKLDGNQTDAMLQFAVNQPWFNFRYMEQRAPPVLGLDGHNQMLSVSGITINPKFIRIDARILQAPTVKYHGNKSARVQEGGWNMGDLKVMKAGTAPSGWKWLMLVSPNGDNRHAMASLGPIEAGKFVASFTEELKKIGIRVPGPPTIKREQVDFHAQGQQDDREAAFEKSIKRIFETYRAEKFLFLGLPEKIPDWQYKKIKVYGDIKHGITTVCINSHKAIGDYNKGAFAFSQYAANVALKVNSKLGGDNQAPDSNKLGIVTMGRTMLVGLDVTHPAPGAPGTAQSVVSMVANVDGKIGQWLAALELNGPRREEVTVISKMLISRLQMWKQRNNGAVPQYIMFFRDGVSEGQFQMVINKELPQIKEAIKQMYTDPKKQPSVFIAVCGKRHHVRFAPSTQADCDSGGNCAAGLVVDRGITETRVWDFYLQPHRAIQGTARSCHYTVLHDEIFCTPSGLKDFARQPNVSKADMLQEFCNALAYTYPRATKAVSLSTPAKLADLACDRARAYVADWIDSTDDHSSISSAAAADAQAAAIRLHDNIKNTMFYI